MEAKGENGYRFWVVAALNPLIERSPGMEHPLHTIGVNNNICRLNLPADDTKRAAGCVLRAAADRFLVQTYPKRRGGPLFLQPFALFWLGKLQPELQEVARPTVGSAWVRNGVLGRKCGAARGGRSMRLHRVPLLFLGSVLGSFVPGSRYGSSRHSLCYTYWKVSESSQEPPQFLSMVHLDNQPIARFDNHTRKMEPLVPWMEAEETKNFVVFEKVFRPDLKMLSNFNHQTGEPHTWQVMLGCEFWEDGSKGGFLHYGYDGKDFISFDKETLRWVAAQPQAQKVKEEWEEDPRWSQRNQVFLEETCFEMLQKCLSYRNEALQRTEPPVGKVTRQTVDDSLEVLICQAFGFYPKEIQAIWTRDGEACQYETLPRNVVPNSDGTYYLWLSIEIDPKKRDHFRCHLEHEGLQEPLVLAWKDETAVESPAFEIFLLILAPVSLCLILGCWLRIRKKLQQDMTSCPDHSYLEMHPSAPIYGTEDTIQPQLMFQPKTASEHKVSCGGWWLQKAPRAIGRTFHRPRNVAPKKTRSSRLENTVFLT